MPFEVYIAIGICLVVLIGVTLPFFVGEGGLLSEALSVNSVEKLAKTQDLLLKRYIQDEKAFTSGEISKRAWQSRKAYIVHRYIDAARRLDFLRAQSAVEAQRD